MRSKYIFATHIGVGNRGCEAITSSLYKVLDLNRENTIILSKNIYEDMESKIGECGKIIKLNPWSDLTFIKKILYKVVSIFLRNNRIEMELKNNLEAVDDQSIVFMTGGDLYCYESTIKQMMYINEASISKGALTMLIGCSIEEKFITDDVVEDLKKYSLITVRESITYDLLKRKGIVDNVYLIPDSAFILEKEENLKIYESEDIVGINLSPYISEKNEVLIEKNIDNLIDYILEKTNYKILFIPHVLWDDQDDRKSIEYFVKKHANSRIEIVQSEKFSYCELRTIIGNCRFFIGARTHSVISAYSMLVPTIALGYSVKSRGIAKDLKLDDRSVVDCNSINNESELLEGFKWLEQNEKMLREHLQEVLPRYKNEVYKLKKIVEHHR